MLGPHQPKLSMVLYRNRYADLIDMAACEPRIVELSSSSSEWRRRRAAAAVVTQQRRQRRGDRICDCIQLVSGTYWLQGPLKRAASSTGLQRTFCNAVRPSVILNYSRSTM